MISRIIQFKKDHPVDGIRPRPETAVNVRWPDFLICLLIVVAVLSVYWPVRHHGFVRFDDPTYITENRHVRTGLRPENIRWAFTTAHAANWHPLTWLSHMLDCQLFGLDAGMHHLVNLLLHGCSALLVYLVLKRMTGSWAKSGFVAVVFALHPLNVESVAWASERKEVLCAVFWMLTLWSYVGYAECPSPGRYVAVLFFFVLGLMAKPMIVTLPFVLLLLDFWPLGRLRSENNEWARLLRLRVVEKMPLMFLTAASCLVTLTVQQQAGAVGSLAVFPPAVRMANALVAYTGYLKNIFWPSGLAFFYPFSPQIPMLQWGAAGVVMISVSCLAVMARRRHPCLFTGWLWYAGALVPVIGLIQVGQQSMADRYTYIPAVGIWIAVAWGVPAMLPGGRYRRPLMTLGAIFFLIVLGWSARQQVGYWRDSATLFHRALNVTSGNYAVHNNLGMVYAEQGKMTEAIEQYRKALTIYPGFAKAHNNLGAALVEQGRLSEAVRHFSEALRLFPRFSQARYNWGLVLEKQGKPDQAEAQYTEALAIDPQLAAAHYRLGNILAGRGRLSAAAAHYTIALELDPELVNAYHHLGNVLLQLGRTDEAIGRYAEALKRDPHNADVHHNLGVAMIRQGDIEQAVHHFREALRLRPGSHETRHHLERALRMRQ